MHLKKRDLMKLEHQIQVKETLSPPTPVAHHTPFFLFILIGVAATLVGVLSNQNNKYVRLVAQHGCVSSWKDIGSHEVNGETLCCTSHSLHPLCHQQFELAHVLSTVAGSWLLPLIPLFIGWVSHTTNSHPIGWNENPFVRLQHYLILMVFRTFILYFGINCLEKWFQHDNDDDDATCDYKHMLVHRKCDKSWNASDHVLLLIIHHIAIAGSEFCVQFQRLRINNMDNFSILSLTHLLSCASAFGLCLTASLCIHQTALFFHTPSESISALFLALLSVGIWKRVWKYNTSK
jgi:hypothetical protein